MKKNIYENKAVLEKLYKELRSIRKIAQLAGVTQKIVSAWLDKYDIKKIGHKIIWVGSKPVKEHIIIMEKHIGRKLLPYEVVHHKNGNRFDNRLENLELTTKAKHVAMHKWNKKRKKPLNVKSRKNISMGLSGRKLSTSHKENIRQSRLGKKWSEEIKKKIGDGVKRANNPNDPETQKVELTQTIIS